MDGYKSIYIVTSTEFQNHFKTSLESMDYYSVYARWLRSSRTNLRGLRSIMLKGSGTRKLMLKPILMSISQCLGHLQGRRVIKKNPQGRRKMRKLRADRMLALFIMNQLYKVSYEVKLEDGTVIVKSYAVEFIIEDGFLLSHVWEEANREE